LFPVLNKHVDDHNIIPKFLLQKRSFRTARSHRIYDRMEQALLRERIHTTRRDLAIMDERLYDVHLKVSTTLSIQDWDRIDRITCNSAHTTGELAKNRQEQKYFRQHIRVRDASAVKNTVINLSDRQLNKEETSVLSKGGNFAISPKMIPVEDIISSIEAAIQTLPETTAEEIRTESSRILKRVRKIDNNLTTQERQAIRDLNDDEYIIILPADKGNATVVMKLEDYKMKILDLLDPTIYKKIPRDPTTRILRHANSLIKSSSLDKNTKLKLHKSEALSPRLYGVPKIHKNNVPLRPIVNTIGSPTYNIAKYLTTLLKPHIGKTSSYIKDSTHFIEKIKDLQLERDDLLVSFDVVSLFTNVPIKEVLQHIDSLFPKDIVSLYEMCLCESYFLWNGEYYEQLDGVAMGSPLSPVVADYYMEIFEKMALDNTISKPKI
jgi:hypothetical protein